MVPCRLVFDEGSWQQLLLRWTRRKTGRPPWDHHLGEPVFVGLLDRHHQLVWQTMNSATFLSRGQHSSVPLAVSFPDSKRTAAAVSDVPALPAELCYPPGWHLPIAFFLRHRDKWFRPYRVPLPSSWPLVCAWLEWFVLPLKIPWRVANLQHVPKTFVLSLYFPSSY